PIGGKDNGIVRKVNSYIAVWRKDLRQLLLFIRRPALMRRSECRGEHCPRTKRTGSGGASLRGEAVQKRRKLVHGEPQPTGVASQPEERRHGRWGCLWRK